MVKILIGKIYTWGIGEQGQLGRKVMGRNSTDSALTPRPINFKPYRKSGKFVGVYCGGYHTVLVHESQDMFSFGLNNHGQLGQGDVDEHIIPGLVEGIVGHSKVKAVAGGEHFSVALTEDGYVINR